MQLGKKRGRTELKTKSIDVVMKCLDNLTLITNRAPINEVPGDRQLAHAMCCFFYTFDGTNRKLIFRDKHAKYYFSHDYYEYVCKWAKMVRQSVKW